MKETMPLGWVLDDPQDAIGTAELEHIASLIETYMELLVNKAKALKDSIEKSRENAKSQSQDCDQTYSQIQNRDQARTFQGDLRNKINQIRQSKTSDPSKIESSNPVRSKSSKKGQEIIEHLRCTVDTMENIPIDSSDEKVN